MRRLRCGFGLLVGLLAAMPAAAWDIAPIVLEGETAVDAGGATYLSFQGNPQIDAVGDVVFSCLLSDARYATYRWSEGELTLIAMKGELVPGAGRMWEKHWVIAGNPAGDVILRSRDGVANVPTLVVLVEKDGTTTVLAEEGDVPAPGTESYDAIGVDISRPNGGSAALQSRLTSDLWGIFVATAGVDTTVVLEGDSGPHGTYGIPRSPHRNTAGSVVFTDQATPGAAGVYSWSAGTATRIVAAGDPAPGTAETFTEFLRARISDSGRIVVGARFGAADEYGIFDYVGGTFSAIALPGQVAPGGGVFESIGGGRPNESGDTLFRAVVSARQVLAIALSSGSIERIFTTGDPAPGVPGSILSEVRGHSFDERKEIVFEGGVAGGLVFSGIFLATPSEPGVPTSSPSSRVALILTLIAAACVVAREARAGTRAQSS